MGKLLSIYTVTVSLCTSCSVFQDMSENSGQHLLVKARFNFQQTNEDELTFNKGDIIGVTRQEEGGWWEGSCNGKTGWFPSNYVREVKGSGRYLGYLWAAATLNVSSDCYISLQHSDVVIIIIIKIKKKLLY